jgi:predicted metal-dependent hydrolase
MTVSKLRVDLQSLQSVAQSLATLRSHIEQTTTTGSSDLSVIGAQQLISAVQDFEDDWSVKRQKLLSSLHAVHNMLHEASKQYAAVDAQLASALSPGN